MTYTLPSFNSTDFRKPKSNKVGFILHNSSKLRNTKVNAVMYPITPCASIVLETITVWLCSGFLEISEYLLCKVNFLHRSNHKMADGCEFYVQASKRGYHAYFVDGTVYIEEVMDCEQVDCFFKQSFYD